MELKDVRDLIHELGTGDPRAIGERRMREAEECLERAIEATTPVLEEKNPGPSKPKMVPADPVRCQCLRPNGATFMTFGGRPELVPCTERPTVIAYENNVAADGVAGCMSLCDHCRSAMIEQMGEGFARFVQIEDTVRHEWGMACPQCGRDDRLQVALCTWADLHADGTDQHGDLEWTHDSMCDCKCGWSGTAGQATIGEEE